MGKLTFSGMRSSKGRHCGVGALLQKLPATLPSLVVQSAASLAIGLDRSLCDVGFIDWSIPISEQSVVPGRGLGEIKSPVFGKDIRAGGRRRRRR